MHRIARTRLRFPHGAWRLVLVGLLAAAVPACDMKSPLSPSGTPGEAASPGARPFGAELTFCVNEINRYRASVGRGPLLQSTALEIFATTAARTDGTAYRAHQHFLVTNGEGTSKAETEILWWRGFSVNAVIQKGLAQMWQVGPQGDHYDILVGPYSEVGCGVFVNGSEVTVAQDFR
jgi:hypothetical protein